MFFNFIVLTIFYVFTVLGKYFHLEMKEKLKRLHRALLTIQLFQIGDVL